MLDEITWVKFFKFFCHINEMRKPLFLFPQNKYTIVLCPHRPGHLQGKI